MPVVLSPALQVTAFDRLRCVAHGPLQVVAEEITRYLAREPEAALVVLNDATGELLPNWHEWAAVATSSEEGLHPEVVPASVAAQPTSLESASALPPLTGARAGSGRPRLGVVAREVTLLPTQWDWLRRQPGGASAALRRLVDAARDQAEERERRRQVGQSAYHCLSVLGEGLPRVDEALTAIYVDDPVRYDHATLAWPPDLRAYLRRLSWP